MNLIFSKKIVYKLIIAITAVVSVISIISALYFSKNSARAMHEILQNSVEYSVQVSKLGYITPLWHLNRKEIRSLNTALLANRNIVAINVYEGNSLISSLRKDLRTMKIDTDNVDKAFSIPGENKDLRMVSDDVSYEGNTKIGRFELFYTERFAKDEIARGNINLIVAFIVIALSITSIVFLIVRNSFVKPVLALADISENITRSNDYALRIDKRSDDEIGTLYDRFNDMLQEIESGRVKLQRSMNMLSNIIESMPSMLVSLDENGVVSQWNHAAEIATGIRAADILGKTIWEMTSYFDPYKDSFRDIITSRNPVHYYRQKYVNGGVGYKNVSLFPLVANGVSGLVIRVDDITESEKKEDQLRQAQKMETIGTLAGGLAHDFNNILAGIMGNLSLLRLKLNSGVDTPQKTLNGYIDTVEKQSQRAADMVQQLLTLCRKQELSFSLVDLNRTLDNVMKICDSTCDKAVELKPIYAEEKAIINADPGQIEQVILNLCVNAYHAMTMMKKEGETFGGRLTVTIQKIFADRSFRSTHPEAKEMAYWSVSIQDTGVGMDSKTIAKIFDPFFTTKERGKGSGLGLSMVYNIVQQHGGFIDVYSEIGLGSTFAVYFPHAEGEEFLKEIDSRDSLIRGEGLILVVDDELVLREMAKEILTECGYSVILAADGQEGVEVFEKEHDGIRLVILDLVMPRKSGKETYLEMKKIDSKVKVLLASGFSQDERVEQILSMGVQGFIQKPYTIARLTKEVRDIIQR